MSKFSITLTNEVIRSSIFDSCGLDTNLGITTATGIGGDDLIKNRDFNRDLRFSLLVC